MVFRIGAADMCAPFKNSLCETQEGGGCLIDVDLNLRTLSGKAFLTDSRFLGRYVGK
jgi:hypothetical protein